MDVPRYRLHHTHMGLMETPDDGGEYCLRSDVEKLEEQLAASQAAGSRLEALARDVIRMYPGTPDGFEKLKREIETQIATAKGVGASTVATDSP